MFTGKSLDSLAAEITRQSNVKRDFIAPTSELSISVTGPNDNLKLHTDSGDFHVNGHASKQIAQRLEIPTRYFSKLHEKHPDLLEDTVNTLFNRESQPRMIRTLDGTARAFLSNKYKRLDNYAVLSTALESIHNAGADMQVASCEVTDTKLYLKAVFPKLEGAVKVGDPVQMGLQITNSEVGAGSVSVVPFIYRLVCTNGMSTASNGSRYTRNHLGAKMDNGVLYSSDTLDAESKAVMLAMRDNIAAIASPKAFEALLQSMQATTDRRITGNPAKAIEQLAETLKLTELEQGNVLTSFIEGADLSQWGMLNAVTDASKKADNYTRASEMESLGGRVLDLNASQWKTIAEAA